MNKKLSLLLTIITPLFIINCSGKPNIPKPIVNNQPRVIYPTVNPTPRVNNQDFLGRQIERRVPPTPVISTPQITKRPTHQNRAVRGTTALSKKFNLPKSIKESSGLIKIDGKLWTINDSGGKAKLYQIDEKNGHIVKAVTVKGAYNHDWEALTYDNNYVYIGDFGNNRGNRKDLKVYKIPRGDLQNKKTTQAQTIHFKYSDQKSFKSKSYKHNFDCEAMVAYHGKLYLFSKNWTDHKTRLYELSTSAGKHIAHYKDSFNVQGLITDATINKELDILLLSSYSELLSVDVWAFTNYNQENFFKGTSKKLTLNSLKAQIEGITFVGNYKAYMSSEAFSKYIFSFDASLYKIDFSREFE
jgi:hypothetical protein